MRHASSYIRLMTHAALIALATPASLPMLISSPAAAQVAPAELVKRVDIPYQMFKLKNGLRVIVHTDRKAPVVAVSVWYGVGSKHEPAGKTGFAHLFEHLMFNGSENAPGDYFGPLQQVGATDFNGTTWFDRTNYFQTVPTSAIETALFLESDRMGHLLGAVTQEKLDNQRSVVQNEKRQGDNQPYGLVEYAQLEALFPSDHPYGHTTIGSMADLDKASLADVHGWFKDHYGPNNAVLVLAGDIDVPTAKKLTEKWFGGIPAGKPVPPVNVPVPTLSARKDIVLKDHVATTRLYRWWAVPGVNDPAYAPLAVGASALGGLASSRLDNSLVKDEQLAVAVTASLQGFAQISIFEVTMDVKPGVDVAAAGKRLDAILADYFAKGPNADEVRRVATTDVSGRIAALEQVGGQSGKAVTLAEGELYSGTPDHYKQEMMAVANATPASVRAAMQTWLTRPVVALTVAPGDRDAYAEAVAQKTTTPNVAPSAPAPAVQEGKKQASADTVDRSKLPEAGQFPNVDFPNVETASLSNGIKVHLARRATVPTVRLAVSFDAGRASDPASKPGLEPFMRAMMDEGTPTRTSIQIAEEQERLGARISIGSTMDRTGISLYALTPNLAPSLDLLADIIQRPSFAPKEMERVRGQMLAAIAAEQTDPRALASRALLPALYGPTHPYGVAGLGNGDPVAVKALTRADLAAFHDAWIRPEKAEIFAVGDISLADLTQQLESRFGNWKAPATPAGAKNFAAPVPAPRPRIILVDRPQSPQSMIFAGSVLPAKGSDDLLDLISANDIVGGNFLGRTNMELRENKGWSYGAYTRLDRNAQSVAWRIIAPVQADKTGDSVAALLAQVKDFVGPKGVSEEELTRTINGAIRELPGSFETSDDVLGEMQRDVLYNRPFDYVENLAGRYSKQTAPALDAAARKMIDPAKLIWVVVGEKAQVLPQLQKLGIPVEVVGAATKPAK